MPSPEPSLLDHIPDDTSPDTLLFAFLEWAEGRGLELYPHQEEAIISIFGGDNVVLATPTGSGKSMVALAGAFAMVAQGKRAVYTAPIKALVSEKFFEMVAALGADNVGMVTGDAAVNLGLDTWEADYKGDEAVEADMAAFTQHVIDAGAPNNVIIDCSASEDVAAHYKEWLQRGINVVTPNKKANSCLLYTSPSPRDA